MLPWTTAGEHICHGKKNCYNNAWVYNVHVLYVYGYINLRIESQHPLVMVQIIYLATVYFSYILLRGHTPVNDYPQ